MCHAINSNWHLTSTSHSIRCLFLLLWGTHCYLYQKIFQSYHFIIVIRGSQTFQWSGHHFKILGAETKKTEHFSHHSQHIFGTTVQNAASWGDLAPGICAPLHQITHRAELLGADTLCRTVLTVPKKNLTMSQDTHLYKLHPPPPPKKKI